MTRKLNDADRAAVDLLLDGTTTATDMTAMSGSVAAERVSAVEMMLKTLDQMPAPEPSPDLAVRTLQFIERRSPAATAPSAMPTFIDPTQPMA